MTEQRAHLLNLADQDHVDVFVLPWHAGAHPAVTGAFSILATDSDEDPDVVYLETLVGGRYIEKSDIVKRFQANAEQLQSSSVTIKEYMS